MLNIIIGVVLLHLGAIVFGLTVRKYSRGEPELLVASHLLVSVAAFLVAIGFMGGIFLLKLAGAIALLIGVALPAAHSRRLGGARR
jgi:hypothetical protein